MAEAKLSNQFYHVSVVVSKLNRHFMFLIHMDGEGTDSALFLFFKNEI